VGALAGADDIGNRLPYDFVHLPAEQLRSRFIGREDPAIRTGDHDSIRQRRNDIGRSLE
jgi:hypothetical protein